MLINTQLLPRTTESPLCRVWTKPTWADAFTHRPDLICTQTSSTIAPDVPTAALEYRYGFGLIPGDSAIGNYAPITTFGYYVLIEWFTSTEKRWWLGYASSPVTTQLRAAAGGVSAAGIQRILCYGIERAFELTRIDSTVHADPDILSSVDYVRHQTGSVFNSDRVGNRHNDEDHLVFAVPRAHDVKRWSRRQIVDHLLTYHLPTPTGMGSELPFTIGDLTPIPDWDFPTIESDNRTLAELLNELVSRERNLGWKLVPEIAPSTPPAVTAIRFTPFSRNPARIVLPLIGTLPANPISHELIVGTDPLTTALTSEDDNERVDQVVVQGPREIGVCTLTYPHDLDEDWSASDETKYREGASNEAGWSALKQHKKRAANEKVRESPELDRVFRSFKIPDNWDGLADETFPVFVPGEDDEGEPVPYVPFLGNVEILDMLPLFTEVNYEGEVASVDEAAGRTKMTPIVLIKRPETLLYDRVESLNKLKSGQQPELAGLSFSLTAEMNNDRGPGFLINVGNGPQHAIAGPGFIGTTVDVDQETYLGYTYQDIIATVALRGDTRPFHAIPSNEDIASADLIKTRTLRIEHPSLQSIHIAESTVVGVQANGVTMVSGGGLLRDPEPTLRALAILAAETWTKPLTRLDVSSSRMLTPIDTGQVIRSIDGQSIDAVVAEVRIDAPAGDGSSTDDIRITVTAAANRLDIMQLLRSPSE